MLSLKQGLSLDSIRLQGAWSPDDEASLEAWYKNAVGITLNGSRVSKWDDSSTNSHDMAQSTTAEQPGYSGGILTFDGVDDNLASSQINLAECTLAIRGDFTSGDGTLLGDDESNAFLSFQSTTVLRVKVVAGLIDFTLASGEFKDGYIVITRDGSDNVNAYYNGTSISAEQNRPGTIKVDNMGSTAGAGGFFDGTIKEVQIYSSTSAALTANINSRLASL